MRKWRLRWTEPKFGSGISDSRTQTLTVAGTGRRHQATSGCSGSRLRVTDVPLPWSLQTGLSGQPGLAHPPALTWPGGLGGSRVFPAAAVSLTRASASRKYRSFVRPDVPALSVCSALAPHDSSPLPVLGPRGWAGRESRWGEGRVPAEILDHNFRLFFCQWHLLSPHPPRQPTLESLHFRDKTPGIG